MSAPPPHKRGRINDGVVGADTIHSGVYEKEGSHGRLRASLDARLRDIGSSTSWPRILLQQCCWQHAARSFVTAEEDAVEAAATWCELRMTWYSCVSIIQHKKFTDNWQVIAAPLAPKRQVHRGRKICHSACTASRA